MSVATLVEISVVIEARHGAEGLRDLDHFIGRAGIELVPLDAEQAKWRAAPSAALERDGIARLPLGGAPTDPGSGSGHRAVGRQAAALT
jgi:uncharacterized protein with PIN domain